MAKGRLFVISGASGVGKSTVLSRVMEQHGNIRFSVSATTRQPREGEQDGVNYYFVTKERFEQMIANDEFLEYDNHMKNYYGTPKGQLEDKLEQGDVLLDIDPTLTVDRKSDGTVTVFAVIDGMSQKFIFTPI